MSSPNTPTAVDHVGHSKAIQLNGLASLHVAVNDTIKEMRGIKYISTDTSNEIRLSTFEIFLTKLAFICNNERGGDSITALVCVKAAEGPGYHFTCNNRSIQDLQDTRDFLYDLLDYVGRNPDHYKIPPLQKQVLWRILEFNHPKVEYYLKRIVNYTTECIDMCGPSDTKVRQELEGMREKARLPNDMFGPNAKSKYLKDCESVIKGVQFFKDGVFMREIDQRAVSPEPLAALPWCELRHALNRLYVYRHTAEVIVAASSKWPELFQGFSVDFVPSARLAGLPMSNTTLSTKDMIRSAFEGANMDRVQEHLASLLQNGLEQYLSREKSQRFIKRSVHCEVHLRDFLVRSKFDDASYFWNDTMFIATSKPPCRLCYYHFSLTRDFKLQSSHMNTYPKWRLPDIYEGSGPDAQANNEEMMEYIIEKLQHDTLRLIEDKIPTWKRNDSRTDTRTGSSTMPGHMSRNARHMPAYPETQVDDEEDLRLFDRQFPGGLLREGTGVFGVPIGFAQ
jgi:hypothetical protein